MKLEKNEYTTATFLEKLIEEFGEKINGSPFTTNDIAQYLLRGYTPFRYGNWKLSSKEENGVRIITIHTEDKNKKK